MSGRIRLLLADVDGTLVTTDKVLTEASIAAARALRGAGILLAVTSSRPPRGMRMLIEPLALQTPIAGFNGGLFVNPDFSVIESHLLDPAVARQALDIVLGKGLDAWVFDGQDWLVRDKDGAHVAHEIRTTQISPTIVSGFTDAHLTQVGKIVGVSDDFARVAACEKTAQDTLGASASAARSQKYYLDVTHPLANKGVVVTTLSKLLSIPTEQIATIGDGSNDVLMFRKSGYSFAMCNASDEVKAQARAVTDSNENDGFAMAVRQLLANPDPVRS
jgi:Cof subfamily protein (haloacid dehalogenase superfamily)